VGGAGRRALHSRMLSDFPGATTPLPMPAGAHGRMVLNVGPIEKRQFKTIPNSMHANNQLRDACFHSCTFKVTQYVANVT
jgi:hypothetical protein